MKLHAMRFEGVGPFAGRVEIDFEALGQSGVFLLEGATGSGKSTIIDALVFALFGDVAAGDSSKARIRSDFAPPTQESYVDLFFEVPDGIYRVRRTPAYERAKLRSKDPNATTSQNATAKLWRLSSPEALAAAWEGSELAGEIEPIENRPADVGVAMSRILGLTKEQFTQTVVLPQGEFATFLRSDTKDRKKVLERVFGTEFYQVIEDEFRKAGLEASKAVEGSKAQLKAAWVRLLEAAGLDEERYREAVEVAGGWSPQQIDDSRAFAAQLVDESSAAESESAAREAMKADASRAAEEAAAKAEARHGLLVRRRQVEERIRERDALAKDASASREALDLHEAAEAPFYAQQQAARAKEQHDRAVAALPEEHRGAEWDASAKHFRSAAGEMRAQAGELAPLVTLEKDLPRMEKDLERAREAERKAKDAALKATESVEARPAERAVLEQRAEGLRDEAARVGRLEDRLETWKGREKSARSAVRLEKDLEACAAEHATAVVTLNEAARHESALRAQRIGAMAAELALDLAPGEPCSVCGSTEHPAPASSEQALVTDEEIEAAESQRKQRETAQAEVSARRASLSAKLEAALAAANPAAPDAAHAGSEPAAEQCTAPALLEAAHEACRETTHELESAKSAARDLASLSATLTDFDAGTEKLRAAAHEAGIASERASAAVASQATALAEARASVNEAKAEEWGSVKERQAALEATAREHAALAQLLDAAHMAHLHVTELEATAQDALAVSAFPTADAVRSARLSDEARATHARNVTTFTQLTSVIDEALADEDLAAFTATEETVREIQEDREKASVGLRDAREAHGVAREARTLAARQAERTCAAHAAFAATCAEHLETAAHQQQVEYLAEVATGRSTDTRARISLSTFVLMRRFAAVVDAANTRLATFSSGQLELALAEDSKEGVKQVGLGLTVIDRRTDKARSTSTLSGGETFFVSLALALGLADIVTAESGGISMNTLFIDEGFGSLDPEKLEGVVAEIRTLAQHGRTVGIVSHVSELKAQVAEKIHVSRNPDGTSRARITV